MGMLEAKVEAVNKANEYAAKLHTQLTGVFNDLVGKKVLKADGIVLEKYKKVMPELPNTPGLRVYARPDKARYSLAWNVNVYVFHDRGSSYHETTVYVGSLKDGVLTELTPFGEGYRTDYTAEEVRKLRETYKEAKKASDEAYSKLYYFGEYDR